MLPRRKPLLTLNLRATKRELWTALWRLSRLVQPLTEIRRGRGQLDQQEVNNPKSFSSLKHFILAERRAQLNRSRSKGRMGHSDNREIM